MKAYLLLSLAVGWSLSTARAQDYRTKLANNADRRVTIEIDAGQIKIEGHNGDEVLISASGYEPAMAYPERAKGLKSLYNSAVDNTTIGLAVTPTRGGLTIEKATRKAVSYTIRLPRKVAVLYQQPNWQSGTIRIANMEGDLEVRTNNARVDLQGVTGPVVANSISGEINVVYANLNQRKPTAISTVNGAVDVTLPATAKTNLQLSSVTGGMYTDFDLASKPERDGLKKVAGGNHIDSAMNGGGVELKLTTVSGNIYLRKQK